MRRGRAQDVWDVWRQAEGHMQKNPRTRHPSGQMTPLFFSTNSGSSSHVTLCCCTVFYFYLLFVWHGVRWVEQNLGGHPRFLVPFLPETYITSAAMQGVPAQVRRLLVLSKP